MLHRREMFGWTTLAMLVVLPLTLWGTPPNFQKAQIANLEVGYGRIDWLPQVDYESLALTVSGPANLYLRYEFGPGQAPYLSLIDAKGDRLPDGSYTYELRTVPRTARESREKLDPSAKSLVQAGFFSIRDGSFVTGSRRTGHKPSKPPQSVTAKLLDDDLVIQGNACIGSDCASNGNDYSVLKLNAMQPNILFDDVEPIGSSSSPFNDWAIFINPFDAAQFAIADFEAQTVPFSVIGGAPDNSLLISENGNIGLGTATPGARLHIYGSATADAIGSAGPDPVSGPAFNFGYAGTSIGRGAGFLNVRPDASATAPNPSLRLFTANVERMIITNTGNVGIGTSSPADKLHLFDNTNVGTVLRVENSNAGANALGSFRAQSDTAVVHFRAHGSGRTISRFGVVLGGWSEIVQDTGNGLAIGTQNTTPIILGTNNTNRVQIDGSTGAVTIAGNLTVNGTFSNPSSRELKEGFAPLDPSMMLKKFTQLPIQEWNYKSDEQKLRHVGPTVEDFRNAFGLGTDGQYIFPMDVQGVTMAAVQGLYQLVQEKDAQIAELQRKLDTELREIKQLLQKKADRQ